MTIKDIEKTLGVPRATIRFYEKEGLINPKREENGYRTYSDEDVEVLKKIIILRKMGLSVNDINDLFDGVKSLPDVLCQNIDILNKQMNELKGAISLSQKMIDASLDINSIDTVKYWNVIEAEEEKGNRFLDIARDIAKEEKKIIFGHFGYTDVNGQIYDFGKSIITYGATMLVLGTLYCWTTKEWDAEHLFAVLKGTIVILILDCIMCVPLYFLGKKFSWIADNKTKALGIIYGIVLLILFLIIVFTNL